METADRLAMLEAREALLDTLHSYAQGWDNRDPRLLRAALHEDAFLDLGQRGTHRGIEAILDVADTVWARSVGLHHWMSDPLFDIDLTAGTATGSAALDCICTYVDTGTAHVGGRYEDLYSRADGVWKISSRRYELQFLVPLPDWVPGQGTEAAAGAR